MALAVAVTCSAWSPKGRVLMKPDPYLALRLQRAVLLQEIFLKGVMQRANWSCRLIFGLLLLKQRGKLGIQTWGSLEGRAACG